MDIADSGINYTIVNVSNVGSGMTNDRLRTMFEKYGTIASYKLMNETDVVWRRFGYVAFEDSDAADEAVIELNGHKIDGERRIKVRKTRKGEDKKTQRKRTWERKYEAGAATSVAGSETSSAKETSNKRSEEPNACVHVSNLDKRVDGDSLRVAFQPYGKVMMAKVIRDAQGSRGYGFVTFATVDEARKAIEGMNGRLFGDQLIRVAFTRGKDKMASIQRLFPGFVLNNRDNREGERLGRFGSRGLSVGGANRPPGGTRSGIGGASVPPGGARSHSLAARSSGSLRYLLPANAVESDSDYDNDCDNNYDPFL